MNKILIYTDGGARGNPGPAAVGVIITDNFQPTTDKKKIQKFSKYIGKTTNNVAEYEAVIFALNKVKEIYLQTGNLILEVRMDSELVVRQLKGEYRVKNEELGRLYDSVQIFLDDFKRVDFVHIPRGENKEADRLVNQVLDKLEI